MNKHIILLIIFFLNIGTQTDIAGAIEKNTLTALSENNVFLKVIVKDKNTPVYSKPDKNSKVVKRKKVEQFHFYYIFPTSRHQKKRKIKNGFYKIGRSPSIADITGWIHKDSVIEWNSREAVRFTSKNNRSTALLYETENDLVKAIESGKPDIVSPISEEPVDMGEKNYKLPLPVIDKKTRVINGKEYNLYELAWRHEKRGGKKLDILFVIDTTRSMQPYIDGVKDVVKNILKKISGNGLSDKINVGLVAYRDYPENFPEVSIRSSKFKKTLEYVKKSFFSMSGNIRQFQKILTEEVKEAKASSNDFAEAMLDGLWTGINETKWRASSARFLVLIGDSSAHEGYHPKNPESYTIDGLLKDAEKHNIRIAALKIENGIKGIKIKKDQRLHRIQMKRLSGGAGANTKGIYAEIKSGEKSAEEFVDKFSRLILTEIDKTAGPEEISADNDNDNSKPKEFNPEDLLSSILSGGEENEEKAKPEPKNIIDGQGVTLDNDNDNSKPKEFNPEDLLSSILSGGEENEEKAKPESKNIIDEQGVTFTKGWVSDIQDGNKVIESYFLISREGYSELLDKQKGKKQTLLKEFYDNQDNWINLADDYQIGFVSADIYSELTAVKENKVSGAAKDGLVFIKGGCFDMGDTFGDGESDEKPVHEVCVDDFYLGEHEVTQGEWKNVMGSNPSYFKDCGDDCPVETVSWNDVEEFLVKLYQKTGTNYRLPTEAEWEFAARGSGQDLKYAGTSSDKELGNYAWDYNNSGGKTHQVKGKSPNSLGLYDMSGNVWEWVQDWYSESYYSNSPENNPVGPKIGSYRVIRGGGWSDGPWYLRAAFRDYDTPDGRHYYIGFRLARAF